MSQNSSMMPEDAYKAACQFLKGNTRNKRQANSLDLLLPTFNPIKPVFRDLTTVFLVLTSLWSIILTRDGSCLGPTGPPGIDGVDGTPGVNGAVGLAGTDEIAMSCDFDSTTCDAMTNVCMNCVIVTVAP